MPPPAEGRSAAETLAHFAADLAYDAIPADVVRIAKTCLLDTIGVAAFGARFPWSRAVADYAAKTGPGTATILGTSQTATPPLAALANGTLAHAFELDSLRFPGTGVHPGATLVPPLLALGQTSGASGKLLLTAFVGACEALIRIGLASRHSSEGLGFHAPGLTGPYGAALAAGRVLGLGPEQLTNALGIAGSLSSGLLAFTASAQGGMVKRLHLGRAAEGGTLAASLAARGFTGPVEILEGRFGFLHAYTREADAARLIAGLGEEWETRTLVFKRYACHVMAHAPVQAIGEMRADDGLDAGDIVKICIEGSEKLVSHHAIAHPGDLASAQYSVPFCAALAAYRDADDPRSFSEETLADPQIRALARRVECVARPGLPKGSWATRVTVVRTEGSALVRELAAFRGLPAPGYEADRDVCAKVERMLCDQPATETTALIEAIDHLETLRDAGRLPLPGRAAPAVTRR